MARWTERPVAELPGAELLAGVVELLDAGTEYYTAVQTIIPIAATSEVIFTQLYDKLVRRAGDPPASMYLLGSDSLPIAAEKSLFDLATWTRSHPELAAALVRGDDPDPQAPEWAEWLDRLQDHLDRYGYTVYNLDFVNPVPADDPAPLIDALRFYLRRPDRTRMRGSERRWRAANGRPPRCSTGSTRCADPWCCERCAGPSGWPRSERTRSPRWASRGHRCAGCWLRSATG